MWRSKFVPETIFRRPIRLKQTDRTCGTIQTHPDELNWARRRTLHERNSLSLMKSSMFGLSLSSWYLYIVSIAWKPSFTFAFVWSFVVCTCSFHVTSVSFFFTFINICNGDKLVPSKTSKNRRLRSAGDSDEKSKRFCSNPVLFVGFTWLILKTRMIRLRVVEGPNAHDLIAFCAFYSLLM